MKTATQFKKASDEFAGVMSAMRKIMEVSVENFDYEEVCRDRAAEVPGELAGLPAENFDAWLGYADRVIEEVGARGAFFNLCRRGDACGSVMTLLGIELIGGGVLMAEIVKHPTFQMMLEMEAAS